MSRNKADTITTKVIFFCEILQTKEVISYESFFDVLRERLQ